jgi:hypothetical protein
VSAVHVSSVRDAHDAHQNPVDVDRVDDAVLTPTRLPAARNRRAKRLAYPVRILGERAVQEGDYGEGDGLGKVPFDRALGARGKNKPRTGSGSCATVGQCRAHRLLVFTARSRSAASRGSTSFAAIVAPSVRNASGHTGRPYAGPRGQSPPEYG